MPASYTSRQSVLAGTNLLIFAAREARAYARGVGVTPLPLSLIFYKNYYLRNGY